MEENAYNLGTLRGFTLLEVVVVMAIVGLLAGISVPMFNGYVEAEKTKKVFVELRAIGKALEDHWTDNQAFPTDLTDYSFLRILLASGNSSDKDALTDEFSTSNANYLIRSDGSGATITMWVYSVGPDHNDDSFTGDDIVIVVSNERAARNLTRKKLNVIAKALSNYINAKNYTVVGSDAWSLSSSFSTDLKLDTYYDTDGWGSTWVVNTTKYQVYSKGPNGVDDSMSSDDISF